MSSFLVITSNWTRPFDQKKAKNFDSKPWTLYFEVDYLIIDEDIEIILATKLY